MEASIALKKIGKLSGDKTVLADLTFGIEKGSLTAIIGKNDAGKSTLMNVMAGIESPNFGSVYIDGLDITKRRLEIRKEIAYVPSKIDLEDMMSIEENIFFISSLYSIDKATIQSRIYQYSEELEISEFLDEYPINISTGILKKAMILRALVLDTSIIYLDEPTSFMDPDSSRKIWSILKNLSPQKTIVYTTQNIKEVEDNHDRILVIRNGKVVLDGNLNSLLETTCKYHQFKLVIKNLNKNFLLRMENISSVVSPKIEGTTLMFYGNSKSVFFDVLKEIDLEMLTDLEINKLGLDELLDSDLNQTGLK